MFIQRAPFWPQAHKDLLDDLPPSHWFVINHARLVREPTRAELCSPYIPLDILDNREEARRQRLAEVMRYLEREAERGEGGSRAHAYPERVAHQSDQASNTMYHDQGSEPSQAPTAHVAVNHIQTQREQGKCSSHAAHFGYTGTHTNAVPPTAQSQAIPNVLPHVPILPPPPPHVPSFALFQACTVASADHSVDSSEDNGRTLPQRRRRRIRISVNQERRELTLPRTSEEKTHLVDLFREEILHNFVNLRQPIRVSAHAIRMAEVKQAILNDGMLGNKPYLLMANITRHDWHKKNGTCVYTVNLKNGPKKGSAEYLAEHYTGVEHTLWEYWGLRKSIRPHHVRRYINAYDPQGFYQAMMYQHLPTREWIGLWRRLRDSGRV
ncbi:hypothetical protein QFC21_004225 [Naganishia friedmannii]|uniref:Uncharacterized protein n=1 Tax=Naganishia friedmannii TaxID=89922 RepID=A0ACC2VHE3_9TREE|nr:hypothetical protein QFC21_004225 [Naganishia friedmannii]